MKPLRLTSILAFAALGAACATETTGPSSEPEIVGVTWRLTGLASAGETLASPRPGNFTLELRDDGRLHVVADCNVCNASYTLGEGTIDVNGGLLACTLAACPSAPFDTRYAGLVAEARTWEADLDHLRLSGDPGRLEFERARP